MRPTALFTLTLRVLMECWVVAGLAWWGYETGSSPATRAMLMIGAPAVGFGIWGVVDFHQLGRAGEGLRLIEELVISGLAAAGLYAVGQHGLGVGLAVLSVAYHVLVYAQGSRLLQPRPVQASHSPAEGS